MEAVVLLLIAALLAFDLVADAGTGKSAPHVALELGAALVAVGASVVVWRRWIEARRGLEGRIVRLSGQLEPSRAASRSCC